MVKITSSMKKRMVIALLCLSMGVSLFAGCTKKTETGSTVNTEKTEDKQETKEEKTEDKDNDISKLSIFVNFSWYPIDSFTGKIPDKIKEITGVDLDVTVASDGKQLGVMIASGELPDLIFTDDTSGNLNPLSNPEVCWSLEDLSNETGVDFTKSENYDDRKKIAESFSSDGKAYTLLNNYNSQEEWANLKMGAPGQPCLYYRADLLEAAGINAPKTLDEFRVCLGEVKKAYPNMTPFGLGGVWKLQAISQWSGVSAQQYNEETGEYRYITSTDGYKDFMKYCNSLYRDGYISVQDYAVENEADGHQMAYNDGSVFYAWFLTGPSLTQLQTNAVSDSAKWEVLNPLGQAPIGENKGWAGAFVSKNCKNIEAAARFVSYLNTVEGSRLAMWGVEGDDFTLDENNVPVFSDNFLAARDDSERWYSEYNTMFYVGSSAINEIYQNYGGMDEEILSQFNAYAEGYKNYPVLGIAAPPSTSDMGVIKAKLEELRKNYEAKVVFTDNDDAFEKAYAESVEAMEKTGVNEYNAYMTEQIKKVKSDLGL